MPTRNAFLCLLLSLAIGIVGSKLSNEEKDQILLLHNEIRSNVSPSASNMIKAVWDPEMEMMAEKWAKRCVFDHPGNEVEEFSELGQNLAFFKGVKKNFPKLAMDHFEMERETYDYSKNQCKKGADCGHYTQIVWANSWKIGCALKNCKKPNETAASYILVCQYSPVGNILGQKPYREGSSCSKCPDTHQYCVDNMCHTSSNSTTSVFSLAFLTLSTMMSVLFG